MSYSLGHVMEERRIRLALEMPRLFEGADDPKERRERVRAELLRRNLGDKPGFTYLGRQETWAQTFQRVYGEPLDTGNPTQLNIV